MDRLWRGPRAALVATALAWALVGAAGLGACGPDAAEPTSQTAPSTTATAATPAAVPDAEAALVEAVGDRLVLAVDVAESKWNSGAPIEDAAREGQAVEDIEDAATVSGVDPTVAADALRAQIEASKIVQRSLHQTWEAEGRPEFDTTIDLVTELRPRLDLATQAMLEALAGGGARILTDRLGAHEATIAARLPGVADAGLAASTALAPFH